MQEGLATPTEILSPKIIGYLNSDLTLSHSSTSWMPTTPKLHSPAGVHLTKLETPSSTNLRTEYQQLISTLLYAALGTRPNIAFAVTWLSWFNSDPTEEHLRYTKYVLRYLKGTKSLWICYNKSSNASLIGYSDFDRGENKDDHHSTLGQVFTLANGAISWASQCQKTVALSVGESEYMELAATGHQCARLRSFSAEIGFPFTQATTICVDNQAVIYLIQQLNRGWNTLIFATTISVNK